MSKEDEEMEFTVDELEQIMQEGAPTRNKFWSEREDAIVRRYYGKVPTKDLVAHLDGRTMCAIRLRAQRLGVCF